MVMQPSFHPADGITHRTVIAQIKFLTYFSQTLAANIPQKIDGKVTRLVFHNPPGLTHIKKPADLGMLIDCRNPFGMSTYLFYYDRPQLITFQLLV